VIRVPLTRSEIRVIRVPLNPEVRSASRGRKSAFSVSDARRPRYRRPDQSISAVSALDELEELHPGSRVVLEDAEHRARDRDRVLFLDAAHRHAEVRSLHDDADAERPDLVAQRLGDLTGQSFLHLQAARKDLDQARDFAEPNDTALRYVGDMTFSEKRQQVMLAEAIEVDVLDDHHLVIIDAEERVVEDGVDVGRIALSQKAKRFLHPLWRVAQPLA
jgi:hypothetical protein